MCNNQLNIKCTTPIDQENCEKAVKLSIVFLMLTIRISRALSILVIRTEAPTTYIGRYVYGPNDMSTACIGPM